MCRAFALLRSFDAHLEADSALRMRTLCSASDSCSSQNWLSPQHSTLQCVQGSRESHQPQQRLPYMNKQTSVHDSGLDRRHSCSAALSAGLHLSHPAQRAVGAAQPVLANHALLDQPAEGRGRNVAGQGQLRLDQVQRSQRGSIVQKLNKEGANGNPACTRTARVRPRLAQLATAQLCKSTCPPDRRPA